MTPLLANAVLVAHLAFTAFVVLGLLLTWIGATLHWNWIRDATFRRAHVAAILVVAVEQLIGVACPLTRLEDWLRETGPAPDFVARWVHDLLYYDAPGWAFTTAYLAWATATFLTWRWIPPRR